MKPSELLKGMIGTWEGTCKTWFVPDKLADDSKVTALIKPILGGKFLRHEYTTTIQGKPRHGDETIAYNKIRKVFQTSWIDDFGMDYAIMFSEGDPQDNGFFVTGKYDVSPKDPPWGWKTVYHLIDANHLTITAYNITPTGQEGLAGELKYHRTGK